VPIRADCPVVWCHCVRAPRSLQVRRCGGCASQAYFPDPCWLLEWADATPCVCWGAILRGNANAFSSVTMTCVRLLCRRHAPLFRRHMPGLRWCRSRSSTCAALCLLMICLHMPLGQGVTPLTGWTTGIATNYGGPLDGKNPYDPSFGTSTVRSLITLSS
jgi:hypothetical protein